MAGVIIVAITVATIVAGTGIVAPRGLAATQTCNRQGSRRDDGTTCVSRAFSLASETHLPATQMAGAGNKQQRVGRTVSAVPPFGICC